MKIKIKELKPNPFKRFIGNGKLSDHRVELLKESIEHGTLPEQFYARKTGKILEIAHGHHRLEAIRQKKGDNYAVDVTMVEYSDEQMLIDLARENMTQRDSEVRDSMESVVLARAWLQSGAISVKTFDTNLVKNSHGNIHLKGIKGSIDAPDSYRSIAKFLSKNGKAISYQTVKNYLDIYDKLAPEIRDNLVKGFRKTDNGELNQKLEYQTGVTRGLMLTKIDNHNEQKQVLKAIEKSTEQNAHEVEKLVDTYREAPKEIQQKIRKGEINLAVLKEMPREAIVTVEGETINGSAIEIDVMGQTRLETYGELWGIMNKTKLMTVSKFNRLSKSNKDELIKMLQDTISRLNGLLVSLESGDSG